AIRSGAGRTGVLAREFWTRQDFCSGRRRGHPELQRLPPLLRFLRAAERFLLRGVLRRRDDPPQALAGDRRRGGGHERLVERDLHPRDRIRPREREVAALAGV